MKLSYSYDRTYNKKFDFGEFTVRKSNAADAIVIQFADSYIAIETTDAHTLAKTILAIAPAPARPSFKVTYKSSLGYFKQLVGTDFAMDLHKWYLTMDGTRFSRDISTLVGIIKN